MGTFKFPCFFILGIFTIRFPDRAVFAVLDERGRAQLQCNIVKYSYKKRNLHLC